MKIDVNTVIQQLRSENSELNESMQYTYEIDPDIQEFMDCSQLQGVAYSAFKEHMRDVIQQLVHAICCMLESKISGNTKYMAVVNQYLSGMGKVDLDQLKSSKSNMETQEKTIKSNNIVAVATIPYTLAVDYAVKKIDEKIQKIEQFLAASQGIYDDFSEKYSLVMQGIAAAKALAYDSSTSFCPSIGSADMTWTQTVSKLYDEKNKELLYSKYGDYLKENPGMEKNMMIIAEYERFHGTDASKYNKLLEPLSEADEINIKIKTYSADKIYRDMMFEYVDDVKLELVDEGTSHYSSNQNKIVLSEEKFRKNGYQTFFHECGHAIDANYSQDNKLKKRISESFVGSDGNTLDQATVKDVESWTQNQADKYVRREYSNLSDAEKTTMVNNITEFVMSKGTTSLTGAEEEVLAKIQNEFEFNAQGRSGALVSDTASGVTDFILLGSASHLASGDEKGSYWTYNNGEPRHLPSSEYFAEYYGYNMSGNTDGLDTVSSMYPESKAVIDEMMSKIENN